LLPVLLLATCCGAQLPTIVKTEDGGRLLVNGKPYLILGGELGNSSAGTAVQADVILPRLAQMHFNTVLVPVSWDQLEPTEGTFDDSILDYWIEAAQQNKLHLILLWFGSWKNSFSNYAPAWVKQDNRRFPRAIAADGSETEILSTFGKETLKSDSTAFAHLLEHLRQTDHEQTVLMVQVENEVGFLGAGRDRSPTANRAFAADVPEALLRSLNEHRLTLSPELAAHFKPAGKSWKEVFGTAADEVFMAWNYARYIQAVAQAGKRAYPIPMYVNAQLPAPGERAGEYPSGGPHPFYLDVYRAAAPALDFYSPDIYWPEFAYWVDRYRQPNNPIFIPEARLDAAAGNALYAFGEARAFGFSPFDVDSLHTEPKPLIAQTYQELASITDLVLDAQQRGTSRGLVLHKNSPRATQTVALGGFLFTAALARSWPEHALLTDDGAMLVLQSAPNEFLIAGSGLTVNFARDPDTDNKIAGIESIEEVTHNEGAWQVARRLNGDQSNQGRQLLMATTQVRLYRVRLYAHDGTQ
jgi:hypothetical protein